MNRNDNEFEIVLGRIGDQGRSDSFINQVLRVARTSGSMDGRKGRPRYGRSTFGRGPNAFSRSRLFGTHRRVVVKARVVRTLNSAPLSAHITYLEREGVTRDGEKGHMFGPNENKADTAGFVKRCLDDRHHFRFIVAPEDAAEMSDLKAFTRDLVNQMEIDLGTRLDWVAIDHWNTDNPHVHLVVRGKTDDGKDLVISPNYLSYGLRSRAEHLVSIELGPKPEHEIRSALSREVDAERWTRLDSAIQMTADETGIINLRPSSPDGSRADLRRLAISRLQKLERMGLATTVGQGLWKLEPGAKDTLRDLGIRNDIIKTMHQVFAKRGQDRGIADYAIHAVGTSTSIIGRLVARGHNELTGEAYAVIDGTDGRAHHVRFRGSNPFSHAPPTGGIVEVRRGRLVSRSDINLKRQIKAPGATWLDYRLVVREQIPLAMSGFGLEVRNALEARTKHLATQGLARFDQSRVILQPNLLATLRDRDINAAATKLTADTGRAHLPVSSGQKISGTYSQRLSLSSGRFAVIDNEMGFFLVPWTEKLERYRDGPVSGVPTEGGGIEWSIGRKRGLGI